MEKMSDNYQIGIEEFNRVEMRYGHHNRQQAPTRRPVTRV